MSGDGRAGVRFCDELPFAYGWLDRGDRLQRTSHALVSGGEVWLVDPVDAPEAIERIDELGAAAGVIQLLDRHARDTAVLAERLRVPLHRPDGDLTGTPFEMLRIARHRPWGPEFSLWWPERRTLVCADLLGTAPHYLAPGERVAVHPLYRLNPPRGLPALEPEHLLVGHGEGVHTDTADAVRAAIDGARRRLPAWFASTLTTARHGRARSPAGRT